MTDQEKAATFIGWKPLPICAGSPHHLPRGRYGVNLAKPHYRCDEHGCGGACFHATKAPDMSDPRNYMLALEGLAERIHPILGIRPDTGKWTCYFLERQHKSRLAHREGETPADAAIKALAALYDAEKKVRR